MIEIAERAINKLVGKRLLTVEEAAIYIGISPRTLYNCTGPRSKTPFPVRAKRIGKLVRFDVRDLDAFVDGLGK